MGQEGVACHGVILVARLRSRSNFFYMSRDVNWQCVLYKSIAIHSFLVSNSVLT